MKITVANTKGGVGKTTSVVLLASVLADAGVNVEVWDADPQGSATTWAELAADNDDPLAFEVVPVNARSVRRPVPPGIDHVLIDTNPHTPDVVQAAVDTSHLIVIPTQAAPLDLDRTWLTLDACSGCNSRVLLTVSEPETIAFREARDALHHGSAPLLETCIRKATRIKADQARKPREPFGYDAVARELGLLS